MLVKVDLHPDVVCFVRRDCNEGEQEAFSRVLESVRKEPIGQSEAVSDPQLSRFMLRFFRFANCLAIFEYDVARNRMKVLECRRVRISKRPRHEE